MSFCEQILQFVPQPPVASSLPDNSFNTTYGGLENEIPINSVFDPCCTYAENPQQKQSAADLLKWPSSP